MSPKLIITLVLLSLVNLICSEQLNESLVNSTLIEKLKTPSPTPSSPVSISSLSSTTETTATNELNKLEKITTINAPESTTTVSSVKQSEIKIVSTSSQYSVSSSVSSMITSASWPRKVSKQCTCGIQNNEETLVDPMPHSWTVGITRNENSPIVCSGSLINNYYVLTTANCARMITGNSRVIIVSNESTNQTSEVDDSSPFFKAHTISDVKINPKFITNLTNVAKYVLKNDIALIRLNEKIDFSNNKTRASTICLPTSSTPYLDSLKFYYDSRGVNEDNRNLIDHESAAITGYALLNFNERNELTDDSRSNPDTYRLWAREATVLSSKECKTIWQQFYTKGKSLCTFARHNGLCEGSLGSSLSVLRYGREQMIGIQSLGSRQCAKSSMPDLFVDVAFYLNWIYKNTVDAVYCSEHQH